MRSCSKGKRTHCTSMEQSSTDHSYASSSRKANLATLHMRSSKRTSIFSLVSILSIYATSAFSTFAPPLSNSFSRQKYEWNERKVSENPRGKLQYIGQTTRKLIITHHGLYMKKKRPMPVIGYNAKEICDFYDRRPLVVGWRLNNLSLPLLGENECKV